VIKKLAIAPQYYNAESDPENGIAVASYDLSTHTWTYEGAVLNGYPMSGPSTLRIASDYIAHYGPWSDVDMFHEFMKLHIFENQTATSTSVWTYATGVNTFFDQYVTTRSMLMDCNSAGLVACIAYIEKAAGVTKNAWAIRCSTDKGVTFNAPYYFPATEYTTYIKGCVRIDGIGNIWVSFIDHPAVIGSSGYFYIYKSSNSGASWTEIKKYDLGTAHPLDLSYTVDSTGQYQYVALRQYSGATVKNLYRSSDYGVNWDVVIFPYGGGNDLIMHTSNKEYVALGWYTTPAVDNRIKVSSDYGSSFSDVVPPTTIASTYTDMQSDGQYIAYVDGGTYFLPDVLSIGCIYSEDNGLTWSKAEIISGGDFNQKAFTQGYTPSVDIISTIVT